MNIAKATLIEGYKYCTMCKGYGIIMKRYGILTTINPCPKCSCTGVEIKNPPYGTGKP